jgi:translocation and assembly module TamB
MLMNAAKGLGLDGGDGLVRKLGSGLGLDEASISSDQGFEESRLNLGKRIGTNLYVKYIVGLLDGVQKMAVEYRFNEKLRLEAEAGLDSSVDLIYRIERD